ncbi:MAG: TolC family protein [Bacteroidetes bacterium]|nr:TolC family protein [Bacteroidota bacterium]
MITLLTHKNFILITGIWLSCISLVSGQTPLEKYIDEGLKNNIVLQQKNLGLDRALYALKEANSLFSPRVSILADYLSGDGGRNISIPVGDLLNPVYATLNQLTSTNNFPQISNTETNFLPDNFYDARVRASMPILNNELLYNRKIQNNQLQLQEFEVEVYKKELIKNIKVAYYQYVGALNAVTIYDSAVKLAEEGKRINESLLANGKSLRAYVLRSESELQNLESKRNEAALSSQNARLYFNFLINSEINQNIDTTNAALGDVTVVENYLLTEPDISKRDELNLLKSALAIEDNVLNLKKSFWYPKISGFIDLGSQASDFSYDDQSRYYLFGFQMEIPIFAGGNNHYKVKQSAIDYRSRLLSNDQTVKQLQLSAEVAKNNLSTSYVNYKASIKQLESASSYERLIDRGYREGINSFIETIDARNQLTTASLQIVINRYQLLGKLAAYEREISK